MRVTFDRSHDLLVLRAEGHLDAVTSPVLHEAIGKALAEQPNALVFDLSGMQCSDRRHLTLLFVASDLAKASPGLPVVVACSSPLYGQMLRLGIQRRLVVCSSLECALLDARRRARPQCARLGLETSARKAKEARDFVGDVCGFWGVWAAVDNARVMINEMVVHELRNGLEPTEVQLALQPRSVHLLVRSRPPLVPPDARGPALRPLTPRIELPLVEFLSRGWGGEPTHDGGEILWCLVDRRGVSTAKGR